MSAITETGITVPISDLDEENLLGQFAEGPGLVGTRCSTCKGTMLGMRVVCSTCVSVDIERVRLSGEGKLYTFTRLHHKDVVRTIGYVDLEEGVRTLADIRQNGGDLEPGLGVQLSIEGAQWFFTPKESGDSNV